MTVEARTIFSLLCLGDSILEFSRYSRENIYAMRKFHTPASPIDPRLTSTSQEGVVAPRTLTDSTDADGKRGASPGSKRKTDPTRYGDWERDGRCIDF